jgi:hypothetical protein
MKTFKNPHRISVATLRQQEGLADEAAWIAFLEQISSDCVSPALCDEGCEVEPDGRCEHGCPAVLVAMGLI